MRIFWFLIICLVGMIVRAQAAPIQNGSTVTINYVLTVDGKVIDRSPMSYVQGTGQIIPGLERDLMNSKKGEKLSVVVEPEEGYGPVNPDFYQSVPKKSMKNKSKIKAGSVVTGQLDGRPVRATVVGMDDKNYFLDLNHPLAGKTLHFDIEIVDIKRPTK